MTFDDFCRENKIEAGPMRDRCFEAWHFAFSQGLAYIGDEIRDEFAKAALTGAYAHGLIHKFTGEIGTSLSSICASLAFEIADACMEEREKRKNAPAPGTGVKP